MAVPVPNARLVDGNGSPAAAPPASGLLEPADNLTAFGTCDPSRMFGATAYFTLAPGSPTLGLLGAGPADILGRIFGAGGPPFVFLPAVVLGLLPGDVIDALALNAGGPPAVISLAPGSPTLIPLLAGPADLIIVAGGPPAVAIPAPVLGLLPGDDVDALDISVDGDNDLVNDACDNCPAVANNSQMDSDSDGIGDACDNCPLAANPAQTNGDGDSIGDACDICTAGVGTTKAQLKIGKLTAGPLLQNLQVQGNMSFPGLTLPTPPLDVLNQGMRVQIVDLGAGGTALLDHQIPGGAVPNVCGPKDGWKTNATNTSQKYANKTTSIPPGCAPGSDLGINQAQAQDKTAKLKGGKFKVKGKDGSYAPATGPFRISIVLGGAAESAAGQCVQHTFAPADCSLNGSGTTLKCKQP